MEAENTPNPSIKPPPLNSDQLNYLIWRYVVSALYLRQPTANPSMQVSSRIRYEIILGLAPSYADDRYTGYADAATKLMRDWKVDAETLPFAKHVKGQALVSLVQKGLRYHHLSLTIDEVSFIHWWLPRLC
jgi:hypothetical protein